MIKLNKYASTPNPPIRKLNKLREINIKGNQII